MDDFEDLVPEEKVNDAVLASSLAALSLPTGAGVGRGTHVIEHD